MSFRTIIPLFIVLILVMFGIWIFQKVTIGYQDARHPPKSNILNNPLSALEALLVSQGFEAESFKNRKVLHSLPSLSDTIFVRNIKQPLTEERENALVDWVNKGGQLIYEPYWLGKDYARPHLHHRFGIQINEVDEHEEFERPFHAQIKINEQSGFLHVSPQYKLDIDTKNSASILVKSEVGTHGYKISVGKGNIIFLSDTSFLDTPNVWSEYYLEHGNPNNYGLSGHDHAYFFLSMVNDRKKVWLIHDTSSPNLFSEIYKAFPFFSVFSLSWLLLFFLYLLKQLGPVQTKDENPARDLSQHIQQSGYYYWKLDKGEALINLWRKRLLQRLIFKHPKLSGLNDQNLINALNKLSNIEAPSIDQAIHKEPKSAKDFINIIKTLKQLQAIK